ncbi:hypothetical protein L6452_28477 [Arctium lappa]|uniref:Uncharacterized protein n=1 Tax=Arctium lappa TaxID=4217 RepID=A0ACB8ZYC7_ARCLA|nr:hypothetical protein L6452_28477 [Arctium lappa]
MFVTSAARFGLTELLEDIEAEDDDSVLVTIVPRAGTESNHFIQHIFQERTQIVSSLFNRKKKKDENVLKTSPENGTMSVSAPVTGKSRLPRNYDMMHLGLRLVCLSASVASVVVMTTAKQRSTISLYGFDLPVYSKWSFSDSFGS